MISDYSIKQVITILVIRLRERSNIVAEFLGRSSYQADHLASFFE